MEPAFSRQPIIEHYESWGADPDELRDSPSCAQVALNLRSIVSLEEPTCILTDKGMTPQ